MRSGTVAAVDLGASSGRVMVARVGPGLLDMHAVARFGNEPVRVWNGTREALYTDLTGLYREVGAGLATAARRHHDLLGIGVDSWAVDYGLLRDGRLLSEPLHYRDERSARGVELVHAAVDPAELYARNGLQFLPFNTLYQLAAEQADGLLGAADQVLLIPDLVNYWLTGVCAAERTNASTTGLLGLDGRWDTGLMTRLGLPSTLFPGVVEAGSRRGPVLADAAARLGLPAATEVVSVASHDTASAVVAVPMQADSAAYISCGTWGLVGVETESAVVTAQARDARFTNEVGADGRTRFLHNVMGLWLLSECLRTYRSQGRPVDLESLLADAAELPAPAALFDTDDPRFLAPGDMPARIASWYTERGLGAPAGPAHLVRAIVESLAESFAAAVRTASELSGVQVATVHLVGGGCQNALLCQLTADRLGMPVLAGPVEATALGNVLLTARSCGLIAGDLEALRALVARHHPVVRYAPRTARQARPVAVG
ncbi:MAG: rhamnulokinase family protein [Actinomycetota bacterium]|nr:rhamnulokinase family protein [Actinomycetota bacterium]